MSVLDVRGLHVDAGARVLLSEAAFSVDEGACAAVIGQTGCGKSTLIRALCGLHPSRGRVSVAGVSSDGQGWPAVRARLGVLLSAPGLIDDLSLFDNVAFGLRRLGVPESDVEKRVHEALEEFGLGNAGGKLPPELSGGMRRRGALARALVHQPACLLLDDPTAGLDPITARAVISFILAAADRHRAAVLLTTHDLAQVAARAQQVFLLAVGRLRALDANAQSWPAELGA